VGRLRRSDGNAEFTLCALTRVGRANDNDIVLDDPLVSQFHATIAWTSPGVWEIRDLGSSNGTFVQGVRLQGGERRALGPGAVVSFGGDAGGWTMVDASRPFPEARDLGSGERHLGTAHLLGLRASDGTAADIFEEARGSWVMEQAGALRDVRHGEIIDLGGRRYKVSLPLPVPETEDSPSGAAALEAGGSPLADATLTFLVSADLESVELRVEWGSRRWDSQRACNRALLALAEARLRDERASVIRVHERGWVYGDELCTLANYESIARLNVEVHRARAEFARQGVPGAPGIVQRRRGTGQVRLGTSRVEIVHGVRRRSEP